jgi:hypothetical protein
MATQPRTVSLATRARDLTLGTGSPYRGIALTLVVTFALSFAYLYRERRAQEPLVAPSVPAPRAVAVPVPAPNNTSVRTVEPRRQETVQPQRPVAPPPAATQDRNEENEHAPTDLIPVALNLRRDRKTGEVEGSLANMADRRLTFTVISRDRSDGEIGRTTLALDPGEKAAVGSDELYLERGGHIIIQTDGYQDLPRLVP